MLTKADLEELGYILKTRLIKNLGIDFIHPDRNYLVNLKDGEVDIVYSINDEKNRSFKTNDIHSFRNWHERYNYYNE